MSTNKPPTTGGTNTGESIPTSTTQNSNVDYNTGASKDPVKIEDGGSTFTNDGLFEDTRRQDRVQNTGMPMNKSHQIH